MLAHLGYLKLGSHAHKSQGHHPLPPPMFRVEGLGFRVCPREVIGIVRGCLDGRPSWKFMGKLGSVYPQ